MAFGFHGMSPLSQSATYVCGEAMSWKGDCINNGGCTMTSNCSTARVCSHSDASARCSRAARLKVQSVAAMRGVVDIVVQAEAATLVGGSAE